MAKLIFTQSYELKVSKFLKKHPEIVSQYKKTLILLELNPYHPSLRLHKCSKFYTVSINMSYRISLDFILQDDTIIPIDVGDHDHIYD
jgi:mRNA-degrading endonuclease RelE of RelBE toxin-antitoxin system